MIYFVIPVFNESKNIEFLGKNTKQWLQSNNINEYTFVFVDDCSTDDTIEKLNNHFAKTHLKILPSSENKGPGDAFNRGFNWVLEQTHNPNDTVITLEADNTSDLKILKTMLMLRQHDFDLVLASIYSQGGGFQQTSLFRKILSSIANLLFRFVFEIKVLTLSSFYRVYSVGGLQKIKSKYDNCIEEHGFICMLEILLKAIKTECKIIEVPMVLRSDNRDGKSKMKIMSTAIDYFRFMINFYVR